MTEKNNDNPYDFEVPQKDERYYLNRTIRLVLVIITLRFGILKFLRQSLAQITDKRERDIGWFSHFYLDLNLDSLGLVTLLVDIEKEYDVAIPDSVIAELMSIIDVAYYIITKAKPKE